MHTSSHHIHSDLRLDESDLTGQWLDVGSRVEGDAVAARIHWLLAERLERLDDAAGGWEVLYRDPRDGRLWELSYPHGEMHGGGPPHLALLAPAAARSKYRLGAA